MTRENVLIIIALLWMLITVYLMVSVEGELVQPNVTIGNWTCGYITNTTTLDELRSCFK